MTSSNMTIQGYLQSIREKLHVSPKESQKILREIQTHLMQEAKRLEKKGMAASDAEEQACSDFGDPAVIAKGFRKAYSWFFRTSLRVVVLTLIVMVVVNEVPGRLFFAFIQLFDDPTNISFDLRWFNLFILISYLLFAAIVFMVVRKLTFSGKRLWQLLTVTLLTVYFGEILYNISRIIIGMGTSVMDGRFIFFIFISQLLKIVIMILIYLCLYFTVFKKMTLRRSLVNKEGRGQGSNLYRAR